MNRSKTVKVGIFITIILALFVIGQLWLLRFNVGKEGYCLNIFYNDVSGLTINDPVRIYGIKKGKVVDMKMQKGGVLVRVWLENSVKLKKDATASIQDVAMISGTKTVVMDPGIADEPLDLSRTLIGQPNLGLSTVEIGAIVTKVEELIEILKGGVSGGTGVLKNFQVTLSEVEMLLKENRAGIKRVIARGGESLEDSKDIMNELSLTIEEAKNTLNQINSRKGTIGKLIYDEELYNNLVSTSSNLDTLLAEIRKDPGKFVNISVF